MRKGVVAVFVAMLVTFIVTACSGPSGLPPAKEGTLLRKIQDRGHLIVGVKYDLPTFGYLNPQTQVLEGFDPAVAREVAAYIFGNPSKVEFKEAASKDRIPFLKNGTADLILASMTINEERLKEIDFSIVYYLSGRRLLVAIDSPIKGIADVDGKKVATSKGSSTVPILKKLTKAEVVELDTYAEAVKALVDKHVDAVGTDDITLYGLAAANRGLKIVGAAYSDDPTGAGVAKGNSELLEVVNTVIKNLKSSGKWKSIWQAEIGDKLGITTIPEPPGDDWRR